MTSSIHHSTHNLTYRQRLIISNLIDHKLNELNDIGVKLNDDLMKINQFRLALLISDEIICNRIEEEKSNS